ncbi:RAD52 motif-containing protein 1 isoform X1 [Electrophorus electricus]|uniref:DM1 domain-containing protein n=1 Tax=Electrophorus electricus TaxID=8005 RepID=A0A4W4FDB4_ELEEL|nr:RAD52 motif-containing protein 1 isoform X1 [Electrophorus electricus]XP_026882539.2 RAD52 motif-containing protein 1 isoform X1 [Electrophorus electricus]
MDIEVDIIEFKVPTENNKTIFIWDIQPSLSEAFIYERVWRAYSAFGALYLVKVCPAVRARGFYALVKFYSSAQASKAQRATDKQCLFQTVPLKVHLSTKQNPAFLFGTKALSHAKCLDLANHYLGYNGWSTRIVTLKELSDYTAVSGNSDAQAQGKLLKFGCVVELTIPQHGVTCRGVGVAEEVIDLEKGPEGKLWKRGKLMRWARDKATASAFEKVVVIVLGNGKVAVECRFDPDEILPDENIEAVIQVNDISWNELAPGHWEEGDMPWAITMELSN